jgi:hypothetical protein
MTTTMERLREVFELPAGAGHADMLAAARRLAADARAAGQSSSATAQLERDRQVLAAVAAEFETQEADGVDVGGALAHSEALRRLAARGISRPSATEYADELAAVGWDATVNPSPKLSSQKPRIERDEDPEIDRAALALMKEAGVIEPDQLSYDEAVSQVRRGREGRRSL